MMVKRFVVLKKYMVVDLITGNGRLTFNSERRALSTARMLNKTAAALCLCGKPVIAHFRRGRKLDCREA